MWLKKNISEQSTLSLWLLATSCGPLVPLVSYRISLIHSLSHPPWWLLHIFTYLQYLLPPSLRLGDGMGEGGYHLSSKNNQKKTSSPLYWPACIWTSFYMDEQSMFLSVSLSICTLAPIFPFTQRYHCTNPPFSCQKQSLFFFLREREQSIF